MALYEVLKKLLSLDLPSPEIVLDDDGDICIEWGGDASISVAPDGSYVNWAFCDELHGTDLEQFCVEVPKRVEER